jgi:stage II sporulation protein AB (anti-sigma F factor)
LKNEIKVKFSALSENECFARSVISAFIVQLNPTVTEMADIRTAVSEAVTNAIVHGYKNCDGSVEMVAKILSNDEVYIKVSDKGCGIPDIEQAMQPMFTTDTDGERAGLGFAVMEAFMDTLIVKSKLDRGTTVVMRKKLGVPPLDDDF